MSKINSIRGFNDILPGTASKWKKVLDKVEAILKAYNITEIRTPHVEFTRLFERSVGQATDIVEKEMFLLESRDDESFALRPEGTASTIRALIEHGLVYNQEQRLFYFGPFFRYERPQKGRYRQFHQLGVEIISQRSPTVDVEILLLTADIWNTLGVQDHVKLEINTIGTSAERAAYGKALVDYLTPFKDQLDDDSKRRLSSNPLRILDSKDQATQKILENAPRMIDFFSQDSLTYFKQVQDLLTATGIQFSVNPKLVRGLDYYNDIVFEWTTDKLGAQAAVCGGGRYDGLVEKLGGHASCCFGFGLGFERLMLLLEELNQLPEDDVTDFFVSFEENCEAASLVISRQLRQTYPELSLYAVPAPGKLKKHLNKANKLGARYVIILTQELVNAGKAAIKHLATGNQVECEIADLVATVKTLL